MQFRDNADLHRYELDTGDGVSFANYREHDGVRAITHVETPTQARGRGHAAKLMSEIVTASRRDGQRLRPLCSYAVAYFARHRDAADVLA